MTADSPQQVVFIDSNVPDLQDLLSGVQPGDPVYVLDPASDGIQQIANILAANNLTNLSAITIVSHGDTGTLDLGSSVITDANLASHSSALAEIGASLAPGGSIQLFGCDVAQGAAGQQFIDDFSTYTGGAQVDASTQSVGSTALGGNWTLNAAASGGAPLPGGAPAISAPFTPAALTNFQATLGAAPSDPQLWIASEPNTGVDGEFIRVDDVNGSATNVTAIYDGQPGLVGVQQILIDPTHQDFFILRDNADGSEQVLKGSLTQAVSGAPLTLTNVYTDTNHIVVSGSTKFTDAINEIALDTLSGQVYFVDDFNGLLPSSATDTDKFERVNYDGSGLTTLATVATGKGTGIAGFALDLAPSGKLAVFAVNASTGTSSFTSHPTVTSVLYEATGVTSGATSVSVNALQIAGAGTLNHSLGFFSTGGIAIDPATSRLYFTLQAQASPTGGGLYEYNLTLNPTGTLATIWAQTSAGPTGAPLELVIDPATNEYFIGFQGGTTAQPDQDNGIFRGLLTSTAAPTAFLTTPTFPQDGSATPLQFSLDQQPTVSVTATPTFTESTLNPASTNNTPVNLFTGGSSVADPDNADLVSATVSLSGLFAGDSLHFSNNNNITGSYNSSTGVLTFSGIDTTADYQTALASVQFTSTSDNPTDFGSDTTRALTWTVNDGLLTGTATTTVTVVGVNDPPTLSGVAGSAQFTQGPSTVVLSNAVSVSDPDNQKLAAATVSITGGTFANDGDVLSASTTGTSITTSYNSSTETLVLSGSDTLAHYQSVLDTVSFSNTSSNPTSAGADPTRTVTWVLNDGSGSNNLSTATTTTVSITVVDNPPTLTGTNSSVAFTEGQTVTLSPSVTVSDPDNTALQGATVKIAGGTFANDGDVLTTSTTGTNITASYNTSTETLVLTGSDTLADYQTVLDKVTFASGSNPDDFGSQKTRTVTWVLNDGLVASSPTTTTVSITAINNPPTLNNVATGAQFTEGGGTVVLSNGVSVIDPDNLDLAGATVSITTGTFTGDGDVLGFSTTGTSITASYNSTTETLLLTGSDTLAHYQSVLDSVTFKSNSLNPTDYGSVTTHQVTWVLNDGSGSNNLSTTATTAVTLTAVNNAPTLTGTANTSYTELAAAQPLSPTVTVADPDNLTLVGATVSLTGGTFANDGDVLSATPTGNITVSYDSTTETLHLTGTDTLADYQTVLDSVTFQDPGNHNPTNFGSDPTRTVIWTLNDGSASSNLGTATTTVSITAVNDAPTLANVASGVIVAHAATVTLSNAVSVTDPDNLILAAATVAITGGTFSGDGDVLNATATGNVTVSYDSTTETLRLTGTDTLAHYQSVLDSVTFNTPAADPTNAGADPTRTISWVLNDGSGSNNLSTPQFTTVALQQGPFVGPAATATYTEAGPTTVLSPSVALSDTNGTILMSATVALTGGTFANDGDMLTATPNGNITVSYNSTTETLTLTGSDTLADYQTALDSVAFSSSSNNPTDYGSDPTRTVVWTVNDGAASHSSASATTTLDITAVNNRPTLSNIATGAQFTEGNGPVVLSSSAAVSDPDNLDLAGATVSITTGTFTGDGDQLSANIAGTSITASYNSTTETLTLTGSDTLAHYQSVLDTVSFNSTSSNPTDYGSVTSHQVTWVLNDGSGSNNLSTPINTTTVTMTAVNNPPTLTGAADTSYTEGGAAATLSGAASVADPDSLDLVSATVALSGGTFTNDGDTLTATPTGNITVSYNSTTETLTLTGSDTLADYRAVLDGITFSSSSSNPTNYGSDPTRTVTWTLNDGSASNATGTATTTVSIAAVNNAPTLSNIATGAQFTEGNGPVVLSSIAAVSDPDNLDLVGATVSITTGTFTGDGDQLSANIAGTSITASYNSTTETLTLIGTDTLAHYQSVLDTVSFNSTSSNPTDYGSVTSHQVTWVLNDGSSSNNLSTPINTTTVTMTAVNNSPTLTGAADTSYTEGGAAATLSGAASVADPDSLDLVSATVALSGGTFTNDGDTLTATPTGNITVSYNSTTETLTLTGSDTLADYRAVLDGITFSSSSSNPTNYGSDPTRTVTWTLNDGSASNATGTATTTVSIAAVNNAPTLSNVATGAQFTQGHGAVVLSSAASVSDPDNLKLAGATVSITTGKFTGDGDVLAVNTAGTSITASYNSTTETLTLSGSDTLADYQSVLDTVTFNSTSVNPTDFGSVLAHQVVWALNDGASSNNVSAPATTAVTITPVHAGPSLAAVASTDNLRVNHTITVSPSLSVADPDSLTLVSATVAITAGVFAGDGDVLGANVAGTSITASYNSTTETLTLTGSDTLAHYTSVLDSVTFSSGPNQSNGGADPTRTITWTVNDGTASNNTASAATTVNVFTAKNDFNGDLTSDITFQDTSPASSGGGGRGHVSTDPTSGDAQIMVVNNGTVATQQTLSGPGLSWHLVGSADFNGDGNADIVWQSTNGTPMIWTMNGTTVTGQITLANPGSSWSAVGTGDFNADGNPDLLFQNVDGTPMIETMNGTSVTQSALLPDPGASWHLVGTGDLNGDGKSDIVFQNTDGTPQVWLMNGTTVTASATLADPGSSWKLIGTADFNHDGEADLLFQNTSTGAPMIWTMNGTSVTSQTTLAPATGLTLIGTGEYNGGTQPDLLFQSTSSGAPVIWTMSGTSVTSQTTLASPGGSGWHANAG